MLYTLLCEDKSKAVCVCVPASARPSTCQWRRLEQQVGVVCARLAPGAREVGAARPRVPLPLPVPVPLALRLAARLATHLRHLCCTRRAR